MKATEIKYTKRVNLGNYEHEEVGITAVLDEDDCAVKGIAELKELVAKAIAGEPPPAATETKPAKTGKPTKTEKKAPAPAAEEEEETIEEKEEETETPPPAKPAKGGFKKKGSVYSRTNDTHKAIVADKLTELYPKWKKDAASIAKAKKLSKDLDGTDMLDSEGELLPAFVASLKKGMK